jgi:hypothetical protein
MANAAHIMDIGEKTITPLCKIVIYVPVLLFIFPNISPHSE